MTNEPPPTRPHGDPLVPHGEPDDDRRDDSPADIPAPEPEEGGDQGDRDVGAGAD